VSRVQVRGSVFIEPFEFKLGHVSYLYLVSAWTFSHGVVIFFIYLLLSAPSLTSWIEIRNGSRWIYNFRVAILD